MKRRFISYLVLLSLSAMSFASCGRSGAAADPFTRQDVEEAPAKAAEFRLDTAKKSSGSEFNSMEIILDQEQPADMCRYEYTADYSDSKSGKICAVSFSDNGHSYEMCISGIAEEFTDDQINTLIGAFLSETPATIVSDDLIDAEKFSIYMHGGVGNWVFSDDDFRQADHDDWGDNSMCWAGSASDMLWNTGWAQLATQKNPDLAINSVDDLFTYYCSNFPNRAALNAYDAVDWFLDGGYAGLSPGIVPGNLPEYDTADYAKSVSIADGDSIENGVELIRAIKEGGTVGLAVDFSHDSYRLKENSNIAVSFDPDHNGYTEDRYAEINNDTETVKSAFYVYDDQGRIMIVDKKDEETYITKDGKEYDVFNVLKGDLYPTGNGSYAPIDDERWITYSLIYDPEEIDFSDADTIIVLGNGEHAITVFGYVVDTDEDQPADSVKALFIVDSDNDADYYNMPKDARGNEIALRTARPNTMQLFRTSPVTAFCSTDDGNDSTTLHIEGYLKETYTVIAVLTGLKASPQ